MSDDIMKKAAEATEKLGTAFEEFKATNDANLKERDVVLEEKLAKIEADLTESHKIANEAVMAAKRAARLQAEVGGETDLEAKAKKWIAGAAKKNGADVTDFGADSMKAYKAAFQRYMRKDDRVLSADEQKALSVGSDPDGGYLVDPDMSGRIVKQVYETSDVRAFASIQTISTDALEGSYDNDEAGAEWVGETTTRSETTTAQLAVWRIPVHELSAMPKATQKVLDDAEVDVEAWHAGKVAEKFSRTENAAFVTGDGIAKPKGFLSAAESADLTLGIEQFDTGVNGAFAAAPNGGDVLINALYGLKTQYRSAATWFMNRATLTLLRKLKDSDGSYLWSPGIAAGQPSSLMGYPLATFEDMPDPATGSLSIAVGDMRAAYQIVDRAGIRVLRDPYTSKPFVKFYTTKRVGGDLLNGEALKLIAFKA